MSDVSSPAAPYVFEHGIEVAVGKANPPAGLARLASREPDSIYSGYTLSIIDGDGSSLNHRAAYLVDVPGVSVEHQLSFAVDHLRLEALSVDIASYFAAILFVVWIASRGSRQTGRSRRQPPAAPEL